VASPCAFPPSRVRRAARLSLSSSIATPTRGGRTRNVFGLPVCGVEKADMVAMRSRKRFVTADVFAQALHFLQFSLHNIHAVSIVKRSNA
jgi:hypothetical protein